MAPRGGRPVRLLGLTGSIGTGKSTAGRLFAEEGACVIDADVLARRVVEPGKPALAEIRAAFGPTFFLPDGSLDRIALGARIFADPEARRRLNAIVHPRVEEEARREMAAVWAANPETLVVYDVPLLFEAGLEHRFDAVVVVYATRAQQLRRLVARDGISPEEAQTRISAQMDIEEKARRADFVLDNTGSADELRAQVRDLLRRCRAGFPN